VNDDHHGEDDIVADRPPEAAPLHGPLRAPQMLTVGAVGLGMGTADLVPAFSGGTVALLTGIYERLVANVRQGARALALLLRGRLRAGGRAIAAIEWRFVLPLLTGILVAIVALAEVLGRLLETHPRQLSAAFLGLVVGAVVVAWGDLRRPDLRSVLIAAGVAALAFVGLGATGGAVADPSLLAFVAAGAVGVCALILPGISGAFLLVLLGMYEHALDAVRDVDVLAAGALVAGALVGLASFSTLLNWLLREHHDLVLAALIGLLAGSTRVLWPWPGTEISDPRLGPPVGAEVPLALVLAIGAGVLVLAIGHLARRAARP
jgi:putative membrane protein